LTNTEEGQQNGFNTDFRYAIVAGWLILPAIGTIFGFFDQLTVFFISLPFQGRAIAWVGLLISSIFILFYLYIFYSWVKRKKRLPILLIILYTISLIETLIIFFALGPIEMSFSFAIIMNIVWIVYFIRSKRVKATFVH